MPRLGRRPAPAPKVSWVRIDNRTGYVTADLHILFARAMRAMRCRGPRRFIVVPSPVRSRGCAEIGRRPYFGRGRRDGELVVIALASPSKMRMRRLARLLEHELGHTQGLEHGDMTENMYWSLGGVPAWAKGIRLRHRKRVPG